MANNSQIMNSAINMLIANLIEVDGKRAKSIEMGEYRIRPEDLEATHPHHARILGIILDFEMRDIVPSYTNVAQALHATGQGEVLITLGVDETEGIMADRSEDADVYTVAFSIKELYLKTRRNLSIKSRVNEIIDGVFGSPDERLMEISALIRDHIDLKTLQRRYNQQEAFIAWMENQRKRVAVRDAGGSLGPDWPWEGLRELVPYMKRGEVTTLQGKSKYGKSTVGSILAEHWAHKQGYMVFVYMFETSIISYMDRAIARNCGILVQDQRIAKFKPDGGEETTQEALDALAAYERRLANSPGSIVYIEAAGWKPDRLEMEFQSNEQIAQTMGMEAVHLIDYFTEIEVEQWMHHSNAYNRLADWLKMQAETQKLYLFVLAQENEYNESPFEGTNIRKRSQVYMRMHRKIAKEVAPVYRDRDSYVQLKDAMHRPMFWHQPGQLDSQMFIQVLLANDDATGDVSLRSQMAYFRIGAGANITVAEWGEE